MKKGLLLLTSNTLAMVRLLMIRQWLLVVLCVLVLRQTCLASSLLNPPKPTENRTSTDILENDYAAGVVDVGQVHQTVFNNGQLGTWGWAFHIVPELPAGWYKGYGYVPSLNLWLGAPDGSWAPRYYDVARGESLSMGPTVSEGELVSLAGETDWGPVPGALGTLHSGKAKVRDVAPSSALASLPLLATSTMPSSWPVDGNERPFWPGPWGLNPWTDIPEPGRFISDQELFFSVTDSPFAAHDQLSNQGYPLDIRLNISVPAFDAPYEDVLYYSVAVINVGSHDYAGLHIGVYLDADIPEYDMARIINDRYDLAGYDAELGLGYMYDYRWDSGTWPVDDADAYRVHAGIELLQTPDGLGVTNWHWFEWETRPGVILPERQEYVQYHVLSGDTTGLKDEVREACFHPDAAGNLDPHFDSAETMPLEYPKGLDCAFLISTGPFDLAAGETTLVSWALVFGDDREDLIGNARLARELWTHSFVRLHPRITEPYVTSEMLSPDTSVITVIARIYDHDGIAEVTGYVEQEDGMLLDSLRLWDDGAHGDGSAADSVYGNRFFLTTPMEYYFLSVAARDSQSYATRSDRLISFWAGLGGLPPFDLAAEGQEEKIYLFWSPNRDCCTSGYQIYYDTDGPEPPYLGYDAIQGPSPIAVVSGLDSSFVLSGLTNDVRYYVNITAFDAFGHESGFPPAASAVPGVNLPPRVSFYALSRDGKIELDWSTYETARPADLKSFHVYRSVNLGYTFEQIGSSAETRFMDTGLSNALPYLYSVTAEDSFGHERWPVSPVQATPVPETRGFPLETGGETDYYGATVADIDGDDVHELIVSNRDAQGYALHLLELDNRENPGWPVRLNLSPEIRLTTRAVGDLDRDGDQEIVAGSTDVSDAASGVSVYAWHHDGSAVAGWPRYIPEAYFSAVAIADIDGGGDLEVTAGAMNPNLGSGSVYVWRTDGTILPGWPKRSRTFGFTHPSVADLNGDGLADVLAVSDSLYVWDHAGKALPGWPQPCQATYNSPVIGDISGDGEPDVLVAGLAGRVFAWDREGKTLPGWPVTLLGALPYYSGLGDVDGDGDPELAVPAFLGSGLTFLDGQGKPAVNPIGVPDAQWFAFPRIVDLDGEEGMEILAEVYDRNTNASYLYAWRPDGTVLYGWPISTFQSNYATTVCDIDGDGALDIVTAQGPYVMSYTFGHPFHSDRMDWPMTHHDLSQTNSYDFETPSTSVLVQSILARGQTDGVHIQWSLMNPVDCIGVRIFRACSEKGPFEELQTDVEVTGAVSHSFDRDVLFGRPYSYELELRTSADGWKRFGPVAVEWSIPAEFHLSQNYPNPFNPATTINYHIPMTKSQTHALLRVYNVLGQEVKVLVDAHQQPGYYSVIWDGKDGQGRDVSSGIYFYRLVAGPFEASRSMVLLR